MTNTEGDIVMEPGAAIETILNLSHFHREHELFYSRAPLETAVKLQVASRALKALAGRWQTGGSMEYSAATGPISAGATNRYRGCEDLNESAATDALGILFMEGEGEPVELTKLKRDLLAIADESEEGGRWLDEAMHGSWEASEALITIHPLARVLSDRHRIVVNNWVMASHSGLIAKLLRRAVGVLDAVELTPTAIRTDLADAGATPAYVFSAAELIDLAADLSTEAGLLVHDSEPRWRRFRDQVADLAGP